MNKNDTARVVVPILAGTAGAVIGMSLKFPVYASLGSTLALWGGTLLLMSADKKVELEKEATPDDYINYISSSAQRLSKKCKEIEDPITVGHIRNICSNLEKIKFALIKDKSKINKNSKLFTYYLPSTLSLADKYDEIENQRLTSSDSIKYMQNVAEAFELLDKAYQNILNNIYEDEIVNSNADIKVLNDVLNMEGLNSEK